MDCSPSHEKIDNVLMYNWSPIYFISLNILTINFLLYVWIWKSVNLLGTADQKTDNRIWLIIVLAIVMWSKIITYYINPSSLFDIPELSYMGCAFGLAQWFIIIFLSLRVTSLLEEYLGKNIYKSNYILCCIFPFYYQYYHLYKIKNTKNPN